MEVRRKKHKVIVIATAQTQQHLHPNLLQARGEHIFEHIIEIGAPSVVSWNCGGGKMCVYVCVVCVFCVCM